jgi:hypothetical protein
MWKIDSGTNSGVTSSSYTAALDWKAAEMGPKTILLKNTHASLSLKYRLVGCVVAGGIEKELVPETTLEAGETAEFHYSGQWDRLVLQVANGSGAASYRVDWEGQGA